jgi:hypothetical protein
VVLQHTVRCNDTLVSVKLVVGRVRADDVVKVKFRATVANPVVGEGEYHSNPVLSCGLDYVVESLKTLRSLCNVINTLSDDKLTIVLTSLSSQSSLFQS